VTRKVAVKEIYRFRSQGYSGSVATVERLNPYFSEADQVWDHVATCTEAEARVIVTALNAHEAKVRKAKGVKG